MERITRTIKAISKGRLSEGSIGFMTIETPDHWYNMQGDPSVLEEWLKTTIQKGNSIEFELIAGFVDNLKLISKAKEQSFTDDLISFEDLLAEAHKKFDGTFSIRTELIHNDWEKKQALVKATIEIVGVGEFTAYGDATQENCGDMVKKHWIRMAETRSIARALRWATNNAKTAEEETEGQIDDEEMSKA